MPKIRITEVPIMKKGGKTHWIQGAINKDHVGYCTPITKSTCTGKRKALAMTFKKHHGFHKGTGDLVTPENPPGMGDPMDFQGTPPTDGRWTPMPAGQPDPTPQPVAVPPQEQPVDTTQPKQKKGFAVKGSANITLNTMPLISGMDMLATMQNNAMVHASEMNQMRMAQSKVKGPNDFTGGDMLTYAEGGPIDQYITPNPKEMIEKGEFVQLPNGKTDVAPGWRHDDPAGPGGTPTDLPYDTKIFSDRSKVDTSFASELLGTKVTKKHTVAEVAKKIDRKYKAKGGRIDDPITTRTDAINEASKKDLLDQLFAYQEMMKDPKGYVASQMMAMGGKPCYDCGGVKRMGSGDVITDPDKTGKDYTSFNYMWQNGLPQANGFTEEVAKNYGGLNTLAYQKYANDNGGNLKLDGKFGVNTMGWEYPKVDVQPTGLRPLDVTPNVESVEPITNMPGLPPIVPEDGSTAGTGTKGGIKPKPRKFNLTTGEMGVPGWVPGAVAAIQTLSDYPIFTGKYQPQYAQRPEELNIDPILNRNLAQAKPYMNANSGNQSIDAARALAALSGVQNSDNEAYMTKFNTDAKSKQDWKDKNLNIRNQAELYNLQRQDEYWAKMTQREANKREAIQAIANNAYTNSRKKLMDKHSQEIAGELFPHYDYKPGQGYTFVDNGDGTFHAVPVGSTYNNPLSETDLKPKKKKKSEADS